MTEFRLLKSIVAFLLIMTAIFCLSCNSVGPNSDKLVGQWVRLYTYYSKGENYGLFQTSGYRMSWETTLVLQKGGEGKCIDKTITVWDDNSISNTSHTIEYPIKWETKNDGQEDYLITKLGTGKIIDIQGGDKLKQEQDAALIMKGATGRSDSVYFSINSDKTIKWH